MRTSELPIGSPVNCLNGYSEYFKVRVGSGDSGEVDGSLAHANASWLQPNQGVAPTSSAASQSQAGQSACSYRSSHCNRRR